MSAIRFGVLGVLIINGAALYYFSGGRAAQDTASRPAAKPLMSAVAPDGREATVIGASAGDTLTINSTATLRAKTTIGTNRGVELISGKVPSDSIVTVFGDESVVGNLILHNPANGAATISLNGSTGRITGQQLMVTGQKNFVSPNPSDPATEIVFVSQEGPEDGVYFRGTTRVKDGETIIKLPKEFSFMAERDGMTAVATPVGKKATVWIVSREPEKLVIGSDADVQVDYRVEAVRLGFKHHQAIQKNTHFLPACAAELAAFPSGVIESLKSNGIVDSSGKINNELVSKLKK
ncbi:MAG: hypothetical protein HY286_12155 [Planctomycetes bacterium]|nr:hypothetical protein [Planctomycetota bacterium]